MGVGRAELRGGSKQLKIPPGVGLGGCTCPYHCENIFGKGGSWQPGNPSGYTPEDP